MSTSNRFSTLLGTLEMRGKDKIVNTDLEGVNCGGKLEGKCPKTLVPKDMLHLEMSVAARGQVGIRDFI